MHILFWKGDTFLQDPSESLVVVGRYISENYNGAALHPIDFIDISTGQLVAEVMDPNITTISPVNKLHPHYDILASGSSRLESYVLKIGFMPCFNSLWCFLFLILVLLLFYILYLRHKKQSFLFELTILSAHKMMFGEVSSCTGSSVPYSWIVPLLNFISFTEHKSL